MALMLRALVSVGVLVALFLMMDAAATWQTLKLISGTAVLMAVALFLAQTPILAWRWRRIVKMLNGNLDMPHAVQMSLLGRLFNQVLPASFGGDAVRAWQSTRYGLDGVVAVHSVLIERFTGLVSLVVIALVALPFVWPTVEAGVDRRGIAALGILMCVAGVAFLVMALARHRMRGQPLLARPLALLDDAITATRDPKEFVWLSATGVLSNLLAIGVAIVLGMSLGLDVGFWAYAAVVPLSIVATILPISIAGWGVREGAMVSLLALFNVPNTDALALSLLFGLTLLAAALVGGLIWLPMNARAPGDVLRR